MAELRELLEISFFPVFDEGFSAKIKFSPGLQISE